MSTVLLISYACGRRLVGSLTVWKSTDCLPGRVGGGGGTVLLISYACGRRLVGSLTVWKSTDCLPGRVGGGRGGIQGDHRSTVLARFFVPFLGAVWLLIILLFGWLRVDWGHHHCSKKGDGGGRPSSVMSLGVTSVGGHSHGHPASPIGVGSSWEDIDPRSPEPLVVRGGWLWLIWVVRWTT